MQGSGSWWRLRRKYIWGDARRSLDDRLAHGACRPLIGNDRGGAGSEGSMGSTGGGTAHFVILSGEKRRVLKMAYLKI